MNIAYKLGRLLGDYQRGIADAFSIGGSRPSITDPSAWVDPYRWGDALSQSKKPKTKQDFIDSFTGWVYTCVKRNAQGVASIPLKLYVAKEERGHRLRTVKTKPVDKAKLKMLYSRADLDHYLTKSEEVEEVVDHPFLDLMENVNPHHNARDLKEFTTMFSDLTGECYWLIIDDELGIPGQIWVIPSQHMTPKYGKSLDKAIESYIYRRGNKEIEIPERQIVMFTYPNPNNIFKGFSCVQGIADAVYVQNQMNEFEVALFENRARIGGVVTQKEKVSEPDLNRLRESFKQKHHGAKQAGKTMFLPYGMEFNRDTMSPEELSFIEGRKLNRTEIMAAFDVPEGILTAENVNRSNAEVAAFTHAKYGIFPRCERFAQKINERILPRYGNEANRLFCAFEEVIPEDREFNLKERTESVRGNIITINEARSQIGLDPVDWGDVMWMPFNTSPVEPWKEEETPPPPQEPEVIEGEMVERVKGKIREWLNA